MRILRPALLGFLIAFLAIGGLILLPQRTSDTVTEEGQLPPKLFPIFPRERTERKKGGRERTPMRGPLLRVEKSPRNREVLPGSSLPFSVILENTSEERLRALTVEERFDAALLSAFEVQDGTVERNVIRWAIPLLPPGERWARTYVFTLASQIPRRTVETTLTVTGEDLHGTPTSSRAVTSVLTVIPLPQTGVERWAIHPLLVLLLGGALSLAVRSLLRGLQSRHPSPPDQY